MIHPVWHPLATEGVVALLPFAGAASMAWEQHRLAPGITKIGTSGKQRFQHAKRMRSEHATGAMYMDPISRLLTYIMNTFRLIGHDHVDGC